MPSILMIPDALARSNRLRAGHQRARLDLLIDQLTAPLAQHQPSRP